MIAWWIIVMPTIALAGWAYLYGKIRERARCVSIAIDAVGRSHLHEEARIATYVAGVISGDLLAVPKEKP